MSHFTETTRVGFAARLKNALKGIGLGISFIGIAVYFLFWNEGNSVRTARALAEGAGRVVTLESTVPNPVNEGALVHVGGPLSLAEPLIDAALGVVANAQSVRLERRVEQYAWIEEKRTVTDTKLGGSQEKTTEYTYRLDWTEAPSNGSEFRVSEGHLNPPMPIKSKVFRQPEGGIGGFVVNDKISDLGGATPLLLKTDQAETVEQALSLGRSARAVAGQVVFSTDVTAPAIGDLRISYFASDIDAVSVVGVQSGEQLIPYTADNGRKIYLVEEGQKSASEMFQTAEATNRFKTWMLRAGLMVLLFLGFKALLSVVDVVASILPFLGWISSAMTSLISLALTLVIGGGTMAVAWFYFRPLLSLVIFGIAVAGGLLIAWRVRNAAQSGPQNNL